jgi:hypothetical protein
VLRAANPTARSLQVELKWRVVAEEEAAARAEEKAAVRPARAEEAARLPAVGKVSCRAR